MAQETIEKYEDNKMGYMSVGKLLFNMAIPMMISMLAQALYNVVDSVFVSQISEDALTAVSLAFPVQNLMIGIISGASVGMSAILSRSLGEKDRDKADKTAMQGMFLAAVCFAAFFIFALFGSKAFMRSQTDIEIIASYGVDYINICCFYSFGLVLQFISERLLQSTGRTVHSMIVQGTGAIINIILDPIFIFGYFGVPRMEVAGAAVATVIGQIAAGLLGVLINLRYNKDITLKIKNFLPNFTLIKNILEIGVPSMLMIAIGSVMTYCMNKILIAFSSTAVAVFGAYFKLQSFVFMPVFGLNNAMIPIVSYNYGAKQKERMIKAIKYSAIFAACIMLVGFSICQTIPDKLLLLFNASQDMLSIGVPALRIICISFILAGICIVISSVFQAVGCSIYSFFVSVGRQLVVLVPTAYLFSKIAERSGDIKVIWFAFPIAELMSALLCGIFLKIVLKKLNWD